MLSQKNIAQILLGILILFMPINTIASAQKYESKIVNGKKVNIVTIDLNKNVIFKVITANDKAIGSESMKSMINRVNPIAAINGNYFDAYNTLSPIGPIVKDGVIVNLGGENASFFVDNYNKADIQSIYLEPDGVTKDSDGNEYTFPIGLANVKPQTNRVHMYNSNYGNSVTFSQGASLTVVNNRIININKNPKTVSIPKNGYVIYFASGIDGKNLKLGNEFYIKQSYFSDVFSTYSGTDKYDKAKIQQLVAAGPLLVKNGKNVLSDHIGNFSEKKITTQRAQRSAIGLTKDNKLLMVTQSNSTMNELANIMISLGCDSATNLDGGASSALYAGGKYITTPGRKLNSMLMVVNKPKPESQIDLYINDKKIDIPKDFGKAYIDNNNTMVPLRFISESLGHELHWKKNSRSTIIDNKIEVFPNSNKVNLLGNMVEITSKVRVSQGRTYVPLRFISESLGHTIDYKRTEDKHENKIIHNIYIKY